MIHGAAVAGMLLTLITACAPAPAPTPSQAPVGVTVPEPGQPFDSDDILAAMRASRRPGGVPAELQTAAIAAEVAEAIWTIDGRPWTVIAIGGSCGPDACTLDVAGSRPDADGEDAWTFAARPSGEDGTTVVDASLGSVPRDLAAHADAVARASELDGALEELALASASWLPPPDTGVLLLDYRAGDEEESCRRTVRVDLPSGEASLKTSADCPIS